MRPYFKEKYGTAVGDILPRQLANFYHGSWRLFTTAVGKFGHEPKPRVGGARPLEVWVHGLASYRVTAGGILRFYDWGTARGAQREPKPARGLGSGGLQAALQASHNRGVRLLAGHIKELGGEQLVVRHPSEVLRLVLLDDPLRGRHGAMQVALQD